MSVLVVLAHPVRESFAGAVCERVIEGLALGGRAHVLIDLYLDGYAPLQPLAPRHRHALERCEDLVLVYPTWWSTQPAMLSGWLMAALDTDLTRIGQVLCFVTHGGSRWGNWLSGEAGRHFVSRRLRARCAPGARFAWIGCYGLDRGRAEDRARYLDHAALQARRRLAPERGSVATDDAPQKPVREGKP